jgi:hypothetical protein
VNWWALFGSERLIIEQKKNSSPINPLNFKE